MLWTVSKYSRKIIFVNIFSLQSFRELYTKESCVTGLHSSFWGSVRMPKPDGQINKNQKAKYSYHKLEQI